jgi:hypothetical protein
MIKRGIVALVITCILSIHVFAQSGISCTPLEKVVMDLNDSLKNVLLINEMQDFVTNGYDDFSSHFGKSVSQNVLKKAFKNKKKQHDNDVLSCIKGIPIVTFDRVDSIRIKIRQTRIDIALEDSFNKQINFIYNDFDGDKRDSLMKLLVQNDDFKSIEKRRELLEVYSLLISRPILVEDKYLFIQVAIINSQPHFLTKEFLFKNEKNTWKFVSQYSW